MIYIIGCPRSGTTYMMQCFKAAGINVGDEAWAHNRPVEIAIGWTHIFKMFTSDEIYHLVREPMKVINSLQTIADSSWERLREFYPFLCSNLIERCAYLWLSFTDYMDKATDKIIRVEDCREPLLRRFNIDVISDTTINTRAGNYVVHSIDELSKELQELINNKRIKYGYSGGIGD